MLGTRATTFARPRLRRHLHAEVIAGEGVFLLSEAGPSKLGGRVFEWVVGLLDEGLAVDELVDRLAADVSRLEVLYALHLLDEHGYLEEDDATLPDADAAYWGAQAIDAASAARRLASTTVSVAGVGGADDASLRALLERGGVQVAAGDGGDLHVVLAADYLRPELAEVNARALRHERAWMLAKPAGARIWIGPILRPGTTGCWACLATRLRANREIELAIQHSSGRRDPFDVPQGFTTASRAAADGLVATHVAGWIARGGASDLEGRVLSVDLAGGQTQAHVLQRQPYCPACGRPDALRERPPDPVVLRSQPKRFTADGGHRTCSPQQTLDRLEHHISSITGIGGDLRRCDVAGDDGLVNVYLAGDNRAVQDWSSDVLRVHFRSKSGGKGVGDSQARASGLCESIERFSAYWHGYERRRAARIADLGDVALDPRDVMQYSERQYRDRDRWNAARSRFNGVPVPFDPEAEVDWTPVWSLTRDEVRYLPTGLCYYAYPMAPERAYYRADSNGNAAGNTLEEAILQGFLELVERDAMGIWWYNRVRRPPVALDGFGDAYPERLRAFLATQGRDLWAIDISNDLGIPVFAAFSRVVEGPQERIILGFGAHLEPRLALLRAVTELNQMLTWVLPEERGEQNVRPLSDHETRRWLAGATRANQPHLVALDRAPRRVADFPALAGDDLRDDVLRCQAIVESLGHELLVLDQTRPDLGLPVVKVLVPGLRHCHARLAPGRLYDVPAKLGWLPAQLAEDELNPIPIFL